MNQNIYRVIYNTALACWQVASEHTASKGKTKSQAAGEMHTKGLIPPSLQKTRLYLSLVIAGLVGMGQVHAADVAGIVIDAAQAGNKPTVSIAQKNNVPVINITAPNAAGVSKNYFTDYNVPTQGIILNNTAAGSVTKLGGATVGNLPLGTQSARLIINQVTGTKSSLIAGSHEVAGKAANLVIANPYGITVNGSAPVRFINSSQVTLTTGRPTYSTAGGLDAYNVSGGMIRVMGKGIDSRANSRLDLISRAASITSDIRADGRQLNLITGANLVKADLSDITVKATTTHPAYAIDVSDLGGMYAGQMNIIATEKGVGVNNKGYIALSQSTAGANATLSIDVSGNLTNTKGTISGGGSNTALYNRFGVSSTGTGSLNINSSADINNNGGMMIGRYVTLNADGNINNASTIKEIKVGDVATQTSTIVPYNKERIASAGANVKTLLPEYSHTSISNKKYVAISNKGKPNEKVFNLTPNIYLDQSALNQCISAGNCTVIVTGNARVATTYDAKIDKVATIKAFGADRTQTYTTTDGQKISYDTAVLTINAGGNLNLAASAVSSTGGSAKLYANNINLNTIGVGSARNYQSPKGNNKDKHSLQIETGSIIHAKNNLLLSATQNIQSRAGQMISDTGETALLADKVDLQAGKIVRDFYDSERTNDSFLGIINTGSTTVEGVGHSEDTVASQVMGNKVTIAADNGISVKGSTVFGNNGVDMYTLKGDLKVEAQETKQDQMTKTTEINNFDFGFSWKQFFSAPWSLGVTHFGRSEMESTYEGGKTAYAGSSIGSLSGDINLGATNGMVKVMTGRRVYLDSAVSSTNVASGSPSWVPPTPDSAAVIREEIAGVNTLAGNTNITGKNIFISDINEDSWAKLTTKYSFTGLKLSVNNPILNAANMAQTLYDQAGRAKGGTQVAAVGLSGVLAGYNSYRNLTSGGTWGANLSLGRDTYFNQISENKSISQASNITAGGTVNLTATGAGKAATADTVLANTGSDIYIQGSTVAGKTGTTLKADDDIHLLAGKSTVDVVNLTKTTSAGINLNASVGGGGADVSLNASYNGSKGYSASEEFINHETIVGSNSSKTELTAGNDLNIMGSQVYGNKVYADIGRTLMIRSLQDRYKYDSKNKTFGISLGYNFIANAPKFSVSASMQNINSDYKSVVEQAGIFAGNEGYDIRVKYATVLQSGLIASRAPMSKQNLITKYLSIYGDLKNTAAYTANATSMSIGWQGKDDQGNQPGFYGFTPSSPTAMHASDNAEGKVHSTLTGNVTSSGEIKVMGGLNSTGNLTLNGKTTITGGVATAGNLVINGDTTITDSGIYAKGSITINGNGITIIDNPAVANTVPTAVDTTLATPLKKIFDLNKIETGFDIATTLGQNLNEFRTIKARDIDAIGQTVARDAKGNIIKDPVTGKPMTVAQVAQLPSTDARYISALGAVDADKVNPLSKYNDLQSAWGNGGWGTIVLTSLAGAANGNVTGGTAQLVQNSAINTIQQFAIQGNKALAANINNSLLSAGVKNLLHTIVNCGAAEMKDGSCATAAGATAATVALNALFNVPVKTMSESEKLAYSNLIQTILAGVATGANVNAAEAVFSGKAEVENNATQSTNPLVILKDMYDNRGVYGYGLACDICQIRKGLSLKTQEFFQTDTGKGVRTVWYTTQGIVETTAVFVPQLRAISTTMTIAGTTYKVLVYGDFTGAASYAVGDVVGKTIKTAVPYDPKKWANHDDYDLGIELVKYASGKAVDVVNN